MISIENPPKISYIDENPLPRTASGTEFSLNDVRHVRSRVIKDIMIRGLAKSHLYPNIFFTLMPFKILEFRELLKGIEFRKSDRILDIGCGSGLQTAILGTKCRQAVGIDIDPESINSARHRAGLLKGKSNAEFYCTALENVDFGAESFERIVSFSVIEHIADYERTLRAAHRILKKGGQLAFSVDSLETIDDPEIIEAHRKACSVKQYFRSAELHLLLSRIGFREICTYPIFRSDFARDLFVRSLHRGFRFGFLESLLFYLMLRRFEDTRVGDRGIFLIVKCLK